jgi:hypothetical protein
MIMTGGIDPAQMLRHSFIFTICPDKSKVKSKGAKHDTSAHRIGSKAMTNTAKYLLAATAIVMLATPASARMLDPNVPEDAVEIMKRTQCAARDGEAAVYRWTGRAYGRREGEPDRLLFNLEGMNIRQCVRVTDPVRGTGFRQVSREIMLYLDPRTNEVLRTWANPYTNATVDVMQVANDPVNGRPTFPRAADGSPYRLNVSVMGDMAFMPVEVPLFYNNPLAGDYQEYVGNRYHAMEIFNFSGTARDLLDTSIPTAHPAVAWVRISDWMPWMQMQGRQGQMVFNAVGVKLRSYDDLPQVMRDEIAANYPTYTAPPPGDDARPNETTWTVFQRWVAERRAAAAANRPAASGGNH